MPQPSAPPRWTRHLVYRAERTRTTWKFRVALVALVVVALWLPRGWWTAAIGRSLVCDGSVAPSDAILVENFDADYLVFERATQLRKSGFASRVLVPTPTDPGTSEPNAVALATVEVIARIARVGPIEIVPIRVVEPISLNAAQDVLRFVQQQRIRSVIVVTPLFRSRRSALVYGATLGRAGVTVRCEPVPATRREHLDAGPGTAYRVWWSSGSSCQDLPPLRAAVPGALNGHFLLETHLIDLAGRVLRQRVHDHHFPGHHVGRHDLPAVCNDVRLPDGRTSPQ